MHNFEILTLFPEMLEGFFLPKHHRPRVRERRDKRKMYGYREYTLDKHRRVDDTPYGGGYGMVMACQPVVDCIRSVKSRLTGSVRTIYLSPQGSLFCHEKAVQLAEYDNLILLCGHYEGIDERIIELEIDEELSIGDYVLTGGELPAAVVVDAVARLCDGVLKSPECYTDESIAGVCWSIRSIRVRVCLRGWRSRRCWWTGIMKTSGNGDLNALWSGRRQSGRSFWRD